MADPPYEMPREAPWVVTSLYTAQEFEQLQSARQKSASATDTHTHRKHPISPAPAADSEPESSGLPSEEEVGSEEGESSEEEDEKVAEGEEDPRHQALLAEVTGAASNRKRKRTAIATEAYPDSEYNLPPSSGPAG